ncbi:restriction endonuclease subunit S [Escherichia coli]|uniref:restriction endonuclease subunit S n=1 Tax=Escherichia coli TaxID=562 RepID=UPI000BDEE818|nr:restriction endonuclease subunit S [Escherichia coli]EFF0612773.1 restriction endonuclease subunit S [Escherichia coli]EFG1008818.1 restriction endonuclease subunit S [Escherichia coli]EFG6203039.1 restriction endonuclease subunit S [Escherichia coli]EGD9744111.1 restriction endonuclease subunit S [Escherichia coli]EHW3186294.1 restriction endonuclease subunit S [Escherichia coli]
MSEMSYLEKLLDGVEVEWKSLGEIATKIYSGGTPDTKRIEYWENGTIPWMSSGEVNLKNIERTEKYITEAGLNNSSAKLVPRNSVVIALAGQGKTRGKVARIRIALATNQSLAALTFDEKKFSSDYVFHFLETQYESLRQISSGNSGRGGLNLQMISEYKIPIPCPGNPEKSLAIQSEIVRILDKFTAVTAELTAELNMRKKQYNYYRDQLLSFKEGEVEWKSLEDIALFRRGSFPQPYGNSEWYDGEGCMPFVQVADVADSGFTLHTKTKQQISKIAQSKSVFVEAGTIVVTLQGTIGRVAITQYDCYVDRTLAIFTNFKVKINKKYFAYQLKAKFDSEKEFARGSTLKTITKEEFSKFQLPIPSINEQNRIVSLLDKFDTLAHSIKQGLPREIELRQKQYEYYRDLLFSFPKPETVSN